MIWLARLWVLIKWSGLGLLTFVILGVLVIGVSVPFAATRNFDADVKPDTPDRIVIEQVDVLTMATHDYSSESLLRDRWVVIENGLIIDINQTNPIRLNGERRINGAGKTLMPGLIDMHVHVFDRTDFLLYLSHGVTTVRNMMGLAQHKVWRQELAAGVYPGPRFFSASPTLNQNDDAPFHKYVKDAAEARALVRRYATEGYDLIKVYDGLEEDVFFAIMAEAKEVGIPVAGHLPYRVGFDELLNAGLVSLEHVEEIYQGPMKRFRDDPPPLSEVIEKIKKSGVLVTPTLSAFHNLALAADGKQKFIETIDRDLINPIINFFGDRAMADPLSRSDPEPYLRIARLMGDITKALYEADVPLLLGSDTGPSLTVPGQTTHDEIGYLSDLGFAPYDIIASGTIVAAEVLGLENEIGRVVTDFRADLILVNGDPLADISVLRSPFAVFRDGAYFDEEALAEMQARARRNMSGYETIGWLLRHELTK